MTTVIPTDLLNAHCKPLSNNSSPLSKAQIDQYRLRVHKDWNFSTDEKLISRNFKFNNYYETMAFVNSAAYIAHQQDHHADMSVSYNHCLIQYTTHSVGGLSKNDFICAAKIDALLTN